MKLALYDFKSKQEFIYRTSKIREISGASALLSGIYKKFAEILNNEGIDFLYDTTIPFDYSKVKNDATVVYDGGGNLMVLYKNNEIYLKSNKIISAYLINNVPTLNMTVCSVDVTGNFSVDKGNLYKQNTINKNKNATANISAVLPFTQVDETTFLPVVKKDKYPKEQSISADRVVKQKKYSAKNKFDEFEGWTAVIYIDGNSMGNKLKSLDSSDYNKGVAYLREFSSKIQKAFVDNPVKEIEKLNVNFRQVIGGGDEITLICEAKDALKIVNTYFESLENSDCVLPEECKSKFSSEFGTEALANTACAGIVVSHAKTPFNLVYELAEAACESAKEKAHSTPGNYFDFYYCHAGITADFDTLRSREQKITNRPYAVSAINDEFAGYSELLNKAGRSNVKALGVAAQLGFIEYQFEVERVNGYLKGSGNFEKNEVEMKTVYDMSEFYDLWFAKERETNE